MREINISKEFKDMQWFEFDKYLRNLNKVRKETNEETLLIINTDNIKQAKRLKAMKEKYGKFKYQCEIEATVEEYKTELNIFASWVKWINKK